MLQCAILTSMHIIPTAEACQCVCFSSLIVCNCQTLRFQPSLWTPEAGKLNAAFLRAEEALYLHSAVAQSAFLPENCASYVAALLFQVNPVREKKLTNVRNTGSEEKVSLSPARLFTLEDAIGKLMR